MRVSAAERFRALCEFGSSVISTAEAGSIWHTSTSNATHLLSSLEGVGLVRRLTQGVWNVGTDTPQPLAVMPALTAPMPCYASGWTALFHHGVIEQIPRSTFVVSLGRSKTTTTSVGTFAIHQLHPSLFGGFEGAVRRVAGMATPAKGLFDLVYLYATRMGTVTLPELELTPTFDHDELERWIAAIPSTRLKTITGRNLERLVAMART